MDVSDRKQIGAYFLYCKRKDWSTEEEVRIVQLRGGPPSVRIDPCWLTRLILGKQISEAHEKTIREWGKQREPELVVMKAYFDELDQRLKLRT